MIPSKKYFETVPTSLRYISECTYDCFSLIMLSFLDCIHEAKASDCKGVKKKGKSRTSCLYSYNVLSRLHVYCFILFYPRKSLTLAYNLPGVKRHLQSLDVTWQLLRQDAYPSITQDNLPLLHEYGPCLKTSLMIKVKSLAGSHFI